MKAEFKNVISVVLAAIVLGAVMLGVLNNLRVDEDSRVHWFGGPVVPAEEDGSDQS